MTQRPHIIQAIIDNNLKPPTNVRDALKLAVILCDDGKERYDLPNEEPDLELIQVAIKALRERGVQPVHYCLPPNALPDEYVLQWASVFLQDLEDENWCAMTRRVQNFKEFYLEHC